MSGVGVVKRFVVRLLNAVSRGECECVYYCVTVVGCGVELRILV